MSPTSGWTSPQNAYKNFLLNNIGRVNQVESTLRTLSYLLPASFSSPVRTEYVYSALNLLGLYHDSVLPPSPVPHARYTRYWSQKSDLYKVAARLLVVIRTIELALEMTTKGKSRAQTVVALESFKTLLRLLLLFLTNRRPNMYPPVPERESDIPASLSSDQSSPQSQSPPVIQMTWKGTRTGLVRPTIASIRARSATKIPPQKDSYLMGGVDDGKKEIEEYLQTKVQGLDDIRKPEELVTSLVGIELGGEVLNIVRPLIYAILLKRFGRRDPLPFIVSLFLEYIAFKLFEMHLRDQRALTPVSEVEKSELDRRNRQFWKYLFRGPVWDIWTKPQLQRVSTALQGKPLLGIFSTYVDLYIPLIEEYYYYTS